MTGWSIKDLLESEAAQEPPTFAPTTSRSPFPESKPTAKQVKVRYNRICNKQGRPYWNPTYDFIYPEESEDRPYWNPMGCIGPKSKQFPMRKARPFVCRLHNFCTFCWERRRLQGGLRAAACHADQENVVKWSVSLPGVRTDPEIVKQARTSVVRYLKRNGFDRVTCYVHTFGENPAEGPKGHLDGICSGSDGDIDALDPAHVTDLRKLLLKYHHRPDAGFWEPHVERHLIEHDKAPDMVNELILAGFYAGRPTFHTRRIVAGTYGTPANYNVFLTNMGGKSKKTPVAPLINKHTQLAYPDWSWQDLLRATMQAEEWDKAIGRPVIPRGIEMKTKHLDALIEDSSWRRFYRLPGDEELREQYGKKR